MRVCPNCKSAELVEMVEDEDLPLPPPATEEAPVSTGPRYYRCPTCGHIVREGRSLSKAAQTIRAWLFAGLIVMMFLIAEFVPDERLIVSSAVLVVIFIGINLLGRSSE